jgi:hypothetical protein
VFIDANPTFAEFVELPSDANYLALLIKMASRHQNRGQLDHDCVVINHFSNRSSRTFSGQVYHDGAVLFRHEPAHGGDAGQRLKGHCNS